MFQKRKISTYSAFVETAMGDDILRKYIAFSDNRQGKTAYGKVLTLGSNVFGQKAFSKKSDPGCTFVAHSMRQDPLDFMAEVLWRTNRCFSSRR